jgi:hypothetical protein
MQLMMQNSSRALFMSLRRALLRGVARLLIVLGALVLVSVMLPNKNILGWTMTICALATFAVFPAYVFIRSQFGKRLRQDDPQLAEQLALGQSIDFNGARNLAKIEALNSFLRRRMHRKFDDKNLRVIAELFFWIQRAGIVAATCTFASILAAVVARVVLGQYAP